MHVSYYLLVDNTFHFCIYILTWEIGFQCSYQQALAKASGAAQTVLLQPVLQQFAKQSPIIKVILQTYIKTFPIPVINL